MYRLPDIYELVLYGVSNRGIPNREYVTLRAWNYRPVQLGKYLLIAGWGGPDGSSALPFHNHMMWLGELQLQPGQWLFVYTGPGATRTSSTESGESLLVLHWGCTEVTFTNPNTVPMLFHVASVAINISPNDVIEAATQPRLGALGGSSQAKLGALSNRNKPNKPGDG
jgi:hypothetical protein